VDRACGLPSTRVLSDSRCLGLGGSETKAASQQPPRDGQSRLNRWLSLDVNDEVCGRLDAERWLSRLDGRRPYTASTCT